MHHHPSQSAILDRLALHSPLGEPERRALLDLPVEPVQVRTNQDFVRLGEKVEYSCLVLDGLVGRFGQNREGNRQITAVHLPGDLVDLHSVAIPTAGSALQALAVTTLLRIPHDALVATAHEHPVIAEAFWRECVIDAAALSEWVVNVGRRPALSRLAHLLCEIACRHFRAVPRSGDRFPFVATQGHIGDMLGLTSIHVNRMLRDLRSSGLIAVDGRLYTVLDWPGLSQTGDFDPAYLSLEAAAPRFPVEMVPEISASAAGAHLAARSAAAGRRKTLSDRTA